MKGLICFHDRKEIFIMMFLIVVLVSQGYVCGQQYMELVFTDVTEESNLSSFGYPIRYATWIDFDNDGDLDIFASCPGAKNGLFQNQGDGTFIDVIQIAGIEDSVYSFYSSAWGDIDNDGDHDLFIPFFENWGNRPLYLNRGDGTFVDISSITSVEYDGEMIDAAWFDYNGDRLLDLICTTGADEKVLLFRNEGSYRFTEVASEANLDNREIHFPKGLAVSDFDLDGDMDFYVSGLLSWSNLCINVGKGVFTLADWGVGTVDSANASTVSWGDYNNDGYPDLFVANLGFRNFGWRNSLFKNNGDGTFASVALEAGLEEYWGVTLQGIWVDFNNDGYLDLHVVDRNPDRMGLPIHRLYRNNRDGTFTDVMERCNLQGERLGGYAVWEDYDGDGDMDVLFGAVDRDAQSNRLFRNDSEHDWFGLRLHAGIPSGNCIGAKVKVYAGDETIVREVTAGSVLVPKVDSQVLFGLGDEGDVDSVEVLWPSGLKDTKTEVTVNQYLEVHEGQGVKSSIVRHEMRPSRCFLYPNFPNPFNPATLIRFDIAESCRVKLQVYDAVGREVAILREEYCQPGSHSVTWQAEGLASGVYVLRLQAGSEVLSRKMMVMR